MQCLQVRAGLAQLGLRSLDELVGHADYLKQRDTQLAKTSESLSVCGCMQQVVLVCTQPHQLASAISCTRMVAACAEHANEQQVLHHCMCVPCCLAGFQSGCCCAFIQQLVFDLSCTPSDLLSPAAASAHALLTLSTLSCSWS